MPFQTLYHRRQTANEVEPLSWYLSDAEELSWVSRIHVKRSRQLAKTHLRGLIVLHKTGFVPAEPTANYSVITAAGMEREEERFVVIKELMHPYFGPDGGGIYATNTEVLFENQMNEMFNGSVAIRSKQWEAEKKAVWMAMAVLCPEHIRRDFQRKVQTGTLTIDEVAARLRITSRRAGLLLGAQYERELSSLFGSK